MMASASVVPKFTTNISDLTCRTCLSVGIGIDSHDIFESSKRPQNLLKMLLDCTNIKISKGDSLPKTICGECIIKLDQSHSFKLLCEQSDATLRQQLVVEDNGGLPTDLQSDYSNDLDVSSDIKSEVETIEYDICEKEVNINSKEQLNPLENVAVDYVCVKEEFFFDDVETDNTGIDTEYDSDSSKTDGSKSDTETFKKESEMNQKKKESNQNKKEPISDENDMDYGKKVKRMQCKYCKKSFRHNMSLKTHIKKIHSAYLVNETKSDRASNKKPAAVRKEETGFVCKFCGRQFTKLISLNLHKRAHERALKPGYTQFPYQCAFCGKLFKRSDNCNEHQRSHTKEQPHQCPHCPKKYSRRRSLVHHLIKHSKEQYVVCVTCGKRLASKGSLAAHMLQHNSVRRHKCIQCDKAFFYKSLLLVHMRQHTGEKPYTCPFCEKTFTTTSDLKKHSRRHTGDKPQKCHLCPKKYFSSSALETHVRGHSEENLIPCDICEEKFSVFADFKNHRKLHTRE